MATYFNECFGVSVESLDKHGAFNISLITDLPLFVDPFLLFNSKKQVYQELHNGVVKYLAFLRSRAQAGALSQGLIDAWFRFPEVKQNWLGFSLTGNEGSGLGKEFAIALHDNLNKLFGDFGDERVTKGSHLEKLCLIRDGVGKDNISDFTVNLIKHFLCAYTQEYAQVHLAAHQRRVVDVPKARFNYQTETWQTETFELPYLGDDYVLLTPKDILTRDDTWINKHDLIAGLEQLPKAIADGELRAQVDNYFTKVLVREVGKRASWKEESEAARKTLLQFPQLIDYYIRQKEDTGDEAESLSSQRVGATEYAFVLNIQSFQAHLAATTGFYKNRGGTHAEAHERLTFFKDVIENKGGHKMFYVGGQPLARETDLHIMYRLVWLGTPSDVSREVNDGRGPADFKISRGAADKTIVEFKLAKNKSLERNLIAQAEAYQKASDAKEAIKVIVHFTEDERAKVVRALKKCGLEGHPDIVLIDASLKESASKARA